MISLAMLGDWRKRGFLDARNDRPCLARDTRARGCYFDVGDNESSPFDTYEDEQDAARAYLRGFDEGCGLTTL